MVQKLLETNWRPVRLGTSHKIGSDKAVFSLKSLLQVRREKVVDMYDLLPDLINHAIVCTKV